MPRRNINKLVHCSCNHAGKETRKTKFVGRLIDDIFRTFCDTVNPKYGIRFVGKDIIMEQSFSTIKNIKEWIESKGDRKNDQMIFAIAVQYLDEEKILHNRVLFKTSTELEQYCDFKIEDQLVLDQYLPGLLMFDPDICRPKADLSIINAMFKVPITDPVLCSYLRDHINTDEEIYCVDANIIREAPFHTVEKLEQEIDALTGNIYVIYVSCVENGEYFNRAIFMTQEKMDECDSLMYSKKISPR